MSLRIFHTADVHLGMKFTRGYPASVQEALQDARFRTLERMVEMANEHRCQLFVVAGDLFHRQGIPRKDVIRTAAILRKFQGAALLLLPGNHDFYSGSNSLLWKTMEEHLPETALVLSEPRVYPLQEFDLDVHVYPAPCTAKHSPQNQLGWMKNIQPDDGVPFHIGIAHGSLQGFSPDFDERYYPMTPAELEEIPVQVWLLGHTHQRFPAEEEGRGQRIFFPATPEPDGFDCTHSGSAWLLELEDDGTVHYRALTTGQYRFQQISIDLSQFPDMRTVRERLRSVDSTNTLLQLRFIGRIPDEQFQELHELIGELEKEFFYLQVDTAGLLRKITREDIDREFVEGSFPHRLLTALSEEDELALQLAYEMIQEVRK